MKCPGQDTRYWTPDDISEVPCPKCEARVEFFKDDGLRRCPGCGGRITNPRVTLGCAQWCEYAVQCLGYDPKAVTSTESTEKSLADELIDAVKTEFGDDWKRIGHAFSVLENAERILRREGGRPRVVIAAALLHDIGIHQAERKHGSAAPRHQELEGPPVARRILETAGVDKPTIDEICDIVGSHHSAGKTNTLEFRIIWDADWLVNLPEVFPGRSAEELGAIIDGTFKTETGKALAHARFIEKRGQGEPSP